MHGGAVLLRMQFGVHGKLLVTALWLKLPTWEQALQPSSASVLNDAMQETMKSHATPAALTCGRVPPGRICPAQDGPEVAGDVEGHVEEVCLLRVVGPACGESDWCGKIL